MNMINKTPSAETFTTIIKRYSEAFQAHVDRVPAFTSVEAESLDYDKTVAPARDRLISGRLRIETDEDLFRATILLNEELEAGPGPVPSFLRQQIAEYAASRLKRDPLLDLINAYRSAYTGALAISEAAYAAGQEMNDEDFQALADRTYLPLRKQIELFDGCATTAEGAHAALLLANEEYRIGETPIIPNMMRAAAEYLARA